jgi:hypothetical protein
MAKIKEVKDTSIYYLALNKGYARNADCSDQFIFVNLTNMIGKKGFRSLPQATEFTSQFNNYTELFNALLDGEGFDLNSISLNNMGNPFVLVHKIDEKWQICGINQYRRENQILFHDKAYLMGGSPKSNGKGFDLNITDNLKRNFNLPLPQTPSYDLRTEKQIEKDTKKYDFLYALVNKIKVMISDMRDLKNSNLKNKIFSTENYNMELSTLLHDYLRNDPFEYRDYDYIIENLVESLCVNIRRNKEKENEDNNKEKFSYSMDYQRLFELALFCVNYYASKGRTYKYSDTGKLFIATDFELEKISKEYKEVYQKFAKMLYPDDPKSLGRTK